MSRRPRKKEFLDYAQLKNIDVDCAAYQWEAWSADGWRDGRGFAIISWKQKLMTYSKFHFGMFRNVEQRPKTTEDELNRKRRMVAEIDRVNREDEEREKRKRQQ